jgi:hypothetical protein
MSLDVFTVALVEAWNDPSKGRPDRSNKIFWRNSTHIAGRDLCNRMAFNLGVKFQFKVRIESELRMSGRFANNLTSVVMLTCYVAVSACAATQVGQNALQMADSISHIRETQVLRNVAAAITDHDLVPSQVLLGTGQAIASTSAAPTFKLPHFDLSKTTKELDAGFTDTWSAQWQFTPVTNAEDLRRLRNLYALIASTDEQYKDLECFFRRNPGFPLNTPIADGFNTCPNVSSTSGVEELLSSVLPDEKELPETVKPGTVLGQGPGAVPTWQSALNVISKGDSIDCKLYQEHTDLRGKFPFRRWLFWRTPNGNWQPSQPPTTPISLGSYGDWELGTTSRGCFNDFVILVQGVIPATESNQEPKRMLPAP